jgi:hypothetical protein
VGFVGNAGDPQKQKMFVLYQVTNYLGGTGWKPLPTNFGIKIASVCVVCSAGTAPLTYLSQLLRNLKQS